MNTKVKPKREGPLRIAMKFDEAIKRALTVKPPPEGWTKYEAELKRSTQRKQTKHSKDNAA